MRGSCWLSPACSSTLHLHHDTESGPHKCARVVMDLVRRIPNPTSILPFLLCMLQLGATRGSAPSLPAGTGFGLRVHLIHRDSLFQAPPGATSAASWRARAARSRARAERISFSSSSIPASADGFPPSGGYASPVSAADGDYLATILLGTPAQGFFAIVDTGSDLTWLQSEPCKICYPQDGPLFNHTASSTFRTLDCASPLCLALPLFRCEADAACEYAYQYGDGSFSVGNFSSDSITLTSVSGTEQSFPAFRFGCGFRNEGQFQLAGGVLGLGRGSFSFISQLGPQLGQSRFSYCLLPLSDSFTGMTSSLLLGDAVPSLPQSSSIPLLPNPIRPSYYFIPLSCILVDGAEVPVPPGTFDMDATGQGGTIVDSGTTFSALVDAAFKPVMAAIQASSRYPVTPDPTPLGLELCFDLDPQQTQDVVLPEITLIFQTAHMVLPVGNSYVLVQQGVVCWAFVSVPSTFFSIIGNVQQQNFQVVHDLEANQLAFVPADCATL